LAAKNPFKPLLLPLVVALRFFVVAVLLLLTFVVVVVFDVVVFDVVSLPPLFLPASSLVFAFLLATQISH
jgi:hypothetical protein